MVFEEAPPFISHHTIGWPLLDLPIQDRARWLTDHFKLNINFILTKVVLSLKLQFGWHDKASLWFPHDQFQKWWGKLCILSTEIFWSYKISGPLLWKKQQFTNFSFKLWFLNAFEKSFFLKITSGMNSRSCLKPSNMKGF